MGYGERPESLTALHKYGRTAEINQVLNVHSFCYKF